MKAFSYCEDLRLLSLPCVLRGLSATGGLGPLKGCTI